MTPLDFVVLIGTLVGIAVYGMWRTRGRRNLSGYLKGNQSTGWLVIGISVMATQASAVTFMSMPGQGFKDGPAFIQNYFGAPLALIIIAAIFVPIYQRLKVYTAYEYLGRRFDDKTRLLGAGLFLFQRGLQAGITIYAPAIILSAVLGWRLDLTIVTIGALVTIYTAAGGSEAVSITQKYQMAVIFGGMVAALVVLLTKLPAQMSFGDALTVAGGFHRLNAVDFSIDPNKRYTFWTGLFGGLFLALSYFGTDQSQVQRYLSGESVRESRLGLMFNAVLKIPMQAFILLLGALIFVFYQFVASPVFFNQAEWNAKLSKETSGYMKSLESNFAEVHAQKEILIERWLEAKNSGDTQAEEAARALAVAAHERSESIRKEARLEMGNRAKKSEKSDADYVFITFILDHLPHGLIGLLIAAFFAAALQSKSAELNALTSASIVDFYRHLFHRDATDSHYVIISKCFTVFWGLVAISFALLADLTENLIQAANIVASVFYPVPLAVFLVAFFLKRIGGTAIFWSAVVTQTVLIFLYFFLGIAYLWYNLIGCAGCVLLSVVLQALLGSNSRQTAIEAD